LVEKRKMLDRAEQLAVHSSYNLWVRELNKEVNELMFKENKMWRQWAKSFFLVGIDKNSKYFHSRATQRHRCNKITSIYNSSGEWISN